MVIDNMNNKINSRLLTPEDWQAWKAIRLEAIKTVPEAFKMSYEEEKEFSDETFRKGLAENDIFGAFDNNKLVGTAGFYIYKNLKMQHRGGMFGMYVEPLYRQRGVASMLIQKLIDHASHKVIQLHCSVATENIIATELYKKNGFSIYGTEPRALKVGDKFYDEHLMVLEFK